MAACIGGCGANDLDPNAELPYVCLECWRKGFRFRLGREVKVIEGKRYPTFETFQIPQDNITDPRRVK